MKAATLVWPIAILAVTCSSSCSGDPSSGAKPAKKSSPAHVTNPRPESELSTVHLEAQAAARLGIAVEELAERPCPLVRTVPGDVMEVPGRSIALTAVFAGTLRAIPDQAFPAVGDAVRPDSTFLLLEPLLTPERDVLTPAERVNLARARADVELWKTDARNAIHVAEAELARATTIAEHAAKLVENDVGSERVEAETEADRTLAEARLNAAKERLAALEAITWSTEAGSLETMVIGSPGLAGIVRRVLVAPDQRVATGQPLLEVANVSKLWIRVPVYTGDLHRLGPMSDVAFARLGDPASRTIAHRVDAPPTATATSETVDLYFEIEEGEPGFHPGERVQVDLPFGNEEDGERKTIALDAILYDTLGNAWVYVETEPNTFVRRRVAILRVQDDRAVLAQGPELGARIVIEGAAELFGTEFGSGK